MTERRTNCRYCNEEVILGKHGWRIDNNSPSGYDCPDAPKRYHGARMEIIEKLGVEVGSG
jgi:hypothetical protein